MSKIPGIFESYIYSFFLLIWTILLCQICVHACCPIISCAKYSNEIRQNKTNQNERMCEHLPESRTNSVLEPMLFVQRRPHIDCSQMHAPV